LKKIEKKLCLAFKEIVESRENSRKFLNTFAVKQNARKITNQEIRKEYVGLNSSYRILEHNLSKGGRHPQLAPITHQQNEMASQRVRKGIY
jgi:hypothetical protein